MISDNSYRQSFNISVSGNLKNFGSFQCFRSESNFSRRLRYMQGAPVNNVRQGIKNTVITFKKV